MGATIMAFDPSTATPVEDAGGFDPSTATAVDAKPAAKVPTLSTSVKDFQQEQDQNVTRAGAFTSSALEAAGATPGALAGARTAMAVPQPAWAKPVSGVVGGVVGGYLSSIGITSLEDAVDKVFGTKIVETRKQQQQQYPGYSLAGSVAGGSVNPFMRPGLPTSVGQAAFGGGVMAGVGAGQRAIAGEDVFDPKSIAIDVATGVFTKPTQLGERVLGVKPTAASSKPADKFKPPSPDATPEQRNKFIEKLKKERADRDAKAKLDQAAIKNTKTGEVELHGPKHDEARKAEIKDHPDYVEGFVDERGNFHTREEAVGQAKRSGQLPEDHVLEIPEDGLHSGDLRKVGDENFKITKEQPAGVSKLAYPNSDTHPINDDQVSLLKDNPWGKTILDKVTATGKSLENFNAWLVNTLKSTRQVLFDEKHTEVPKELWNQMGKISPEEWSKKRGYSKEEVDSWNKNQKDIQQGIDEFGLNYDDIAGLVTDPRDHPDYGTMWEKNTHPKQVDPATKTSSAGTVKPPVTREEHKIEIDKLQEETYLTLEGHKQEAINAGDKAGVAEIEAKQAAIEKQIEALQKAMPGVEFKNKAIPTWEELHDHLWGSKTVGEAFDRILATDGLGGTKKRLLLKALNQSEFIRSAELKFSKDFLKYYDKEGLEQSNATGLYTGDEHLVQLGQEGDITVLAHEAMHAGTHRLIEMGNSTAAIKLQELFDKYKASRGKELHPTTGKEYYGFTDVHEFVAEAFTNRKFQELLASIEAGKQPKGVLNNLWGAFKEAVREGLNLPEGTRTALDEVFDQGISLVKKSRDFKAPGEHPESVVTALKQRTSAAVAAAFERVDPRSVPNEEEMIRHAADLHDRFGEAEAVKFFEDYQKNLNERSIPVPNDAKSLDDALHKLNTFQTKDRSEHVVGYKENTKNGVTEQQRAEWFDMRERGEPLPPEAKAVLDELDAENIALVRKIKAMGGDVGEEFAKGQSRIRLFSEKEKPGWKETLKKFFDSNTPMGDRIADQANAAIERKVFALEDGRTIEFHRQPTNVTLPGGREVKAGTEIWEWRDGKKRLIGHSSDINFKRGDSITLNDGTVSKVIDGNVPDIEKNSPYRYWHDAEASARIANTGLRKMARELEFVNNLKQSELFKQIAHGPDQDPKTLPKHYVQPENIGNIPELRGWAFDPKAAAIISDFAKVWDNTMWMKATNALVKNMMLNPVPHMFNEVMHLWNARGFTGWVDPRQLGTFATTARTAWRDVGNQTQFYRDIMREGGSILGADPRNKHFEALQKEAQKQMFGTPEMQLSMTQLAKKLGTTVGDLYNGISNASTKAMWFTRDVMYVQYIREIMNQHEKRTGNRMELKDAIEHAERHMPNYRMPSKVLGSRTLAKGLKNPNIAMFSRYHYGMVKSLVNTIKDVNPRNLMSPEGRANFREGVDSMLAIGVAMAFLYPVMDEIAQEVFGAGAEQRRAGPYHLLKAFQDIEEGKRDASALIWPVFTFNPMLLGLGQLAFNKNIFTGKEIYHPDDTAEEIASDIGTYSVKQVPQAPPVLSAIDSDKGETSLIARQFDIKMHDLEAEEKGMKFREKSRKGRETKRKKGTYKP